MYYTTVTIENRNVMVSIQISSTVPEKSEDNVSLITYEILEQLLQGRTCHVKGGDRFVIKKAQNFIFAQYCSFYEERFLAVSHCC